MLRHGEREIYLAPPSAFPVKLQMRFDGLPLSVGTGFINTATAGPLLITARHNFTGRHQETGEYLSKMGGVPNEVKIRYHASEILTYIEHVEPLLRETTPLWIEHPTLGSTADFVALPLTQLDGVNLDHAVFPFMERRLRLTPSEPVSVIGYPFGLAGAGDLAIWTTGFIATEIDLDYRNLPQFLIDARTRQGQSGSPVLAYRTGMTNLRDGTSKVFALPQWDVLGIYSGRINSDSDIGVVWKISAVAELINFIAAQGQGRRQIAPTGAVRYHPPP